MIAEIDEIVNAQIGKDEPGVAVAELREQGFATMMIHLPFSSFSAIRVMNNQA